jgi:methanogenic corrinoid protein MtbC1
MPEDKGSPHDEIRSRQESLAQSIVDLQYRREPGQWESFGEEGLKKSIRDAGYHLSFLAEALHSGDPSLFSHYIAWVRSLLHGLGFPERALFTTLDCTREVLQKELSPMAASRVSQYIDGALQHLEETPLVPGSFLSREGDGPLIRLAERFLDLLLRSRLREARELIMDAVERGVGIEDLYLKVFQRSQREIGRLWQLNRISVAQEHYCTAATQLIMSQLYPYIFNTEKTGRKMLAACAGGELHELGVRMVADIFEMSGWDTFYLGANVPAHTINQALSEYDAQVLALSLTMTFHLENLMEIINRVRSGEKRGVKILVGGYPFNISPDLWKRVEADGYARDAREAVEVADRLLKGE